MQTCTGCNIEGNLNRYNMTNSQLSDGHVTVLNDLMKCLHTFRLFTPVAVRILLNFTIGKRGKGSTRRRTPKHKAHKAYLNLDSMSEV